MDYDKHLAKSKENFNELEQMNKDIEPMESAMMKPKMKQIDDLDMQDSAQENNENQDSSIQGNSNDKENSFVYKTQGTQSTSELRRQLQEILRELINQEFTNKETGLVASIKQDDIDKISSKKAITKSGNNGFTKEEHFEVAKDIAPLYENATLKETHADRKGNGQSNIANVHRFTIDIEVNGKDTTAKITAFERIKGYNRIYTIELQGLDPLPYNFRAQEAEVAKSLSQDGTLAHTSDPLIANFDNETIPQNSSECQEQDDSGDESSKSTHTRRKP